MHSTRTKYLFAYRAGTYKVVCKFSASFLHLTANRFIKRDPFAHVLHLRSAIWKGKAGGMVESGSIGAYDAEQRGNRDCLQYSLNVWQKKSMRSVTDLCIPGSWSWRLRLIPWPFNIVLAKVPCLV